MRQLVGALVELAIAQLVPRHAPAATASGARAACSANSSCRISRGIGRLVSFHTTRSQVTLRLAYQIQLRSPARAPPPPAPAPARSCSASRAAVRRLEQIGRIDQHPLKPACPPAPGTATGRTWPPAPPAAAKRQPLQLITTSGVFCSVKVTWNNRVARRIANRLQLLHQPLERQILMPIGASAAARTRPPARGTSDRPTGRCAAPDC
jgi:hypothetical protein